MVLLVFPLLNIALRLLATEVTYSAALDACARVPQWREALRFVSPKCEGTEIEQLGILGQCCYTLALQPCNFKPGTKKGCEWFQWKTHMILI